jgi:FKBP-type peptidyl-prolyl cis-trans isomerase 2
MQCIRFLHTLPAYILIAIIISVLSGCSAFEPYRVKPGDNVLVDYTCRLQNGEVVLTTSEAIAKDKASHASIFLPFKQYGPEELLAGGPDTNPKFGNLKIFEREVSTRIAVAVVGMKAGENNTILLTSDIPANLTDRDRYITIGRVVHREKDRRVHLQTVKDELGHAPAVGEQAFAYQGITGTVKEISGSDVVIHINVKDGQIVDVPYGKGIIKDYPDHYDIVTDAKVGHLVRSLSQVGRIVSVTDDKFVIDYGHPFGGEELSCDVRVESVLPGTRTEQDQPAKDKLP